jgi:hypothetical protein
MGNRDAFPPRAQKLTTHSHLLLRFRMHAFKGYKKKFCDTDTFHVFNFLREMFFISSEYRICKRW